MTVLREEAQRAARAFFIFNSSPICYTPLSSPLEFAILFSYSRADGLGNILSPLRGLKLDAQSKLIRCHQLDRSLRDSMMADAPLP
jgi:hypothetical protein